MKTMRKGEEQEGRLFWGRLAARRGALALAFAASVALPACFEKGSEPTGEQVYYFSSLERDSWRPYTLIDQPPSPLSPEELAQLEPIFAGFEQNAERLFTQPDIDGRLESIENAYIRASRYLDILPYYSADIERQGLQKSPAAPRMLWALIRLGQEDQAKAFARELVLARPDDAGAWFLYGAYWIKFAAEDEDAAARVVFAWSKAVELDPSYRGFEGIDARTMRREISRLKVEQSITPTKLDAIGAELRTTGAGGAIRAASGHVLRAVMVSRNGIEAQLVRAPVEPPAAEAVESPPGQDEPGEGVEERAAQVAPAPSDAAPERTARQELLLGMAQAKLDLASGKEPGARATLTRVLGEALPGGKLEEAVSVLDRGTDRFSLVRLCWQLDVDRNGAARLFRAFATKDVEEISSMALYKRVRFAADELEDYALARELIDALKQKDADFAARQKVDELLR